MERYINNWLKQNELLKGKLGDQSISSLVNHSAFSHDCESVSSLSGTVCYAAREHISTRIASLECDRFVQLLSKDSFNR